MGNTVTISRLILQHREVKKSATTLEETRDSRGNVVVEEKWTSAPEWRSGKEVGTISISECHQAKVIYIISTHTL